MKLHIKGDSLRLRLTRSEVACIGFGAAVEGSTQFPPDQMRRMNRTVPPRLFCMNQRLQCQSRQDC